MSFAQIKPTSTTGEWLRAERFISWRDLLHFPLEIQGILTPFREQVLNYIFRTARGLSDGHLESALVEALSEPDEDDSLLLHLALTVKMDWDSLDKLHERILDRLAEWSQEWSEQERDDYARWIFFSLSPAET